MKRLSRQRWLLLALPLLVAVLFGSYVGWATIQNAPTPAAQLALESDEQVVVSTEPWLVFRPVGTTPRAAFIFYPGGLVPPLAYAPAARAIAAAGYQAVIVPMPLNLAVMAPERAADVIAAYPEIERWAIGGHSLGGVMAARFAFEHPGAVSGLSLWASYPAKGNDLSDREVAVVSIYGSEDDLATASEIEGSAGRLPPDTRFVEISGGNHTQFGYYGDGPQRGDNPATIEREAQQAQAVVATIALLNQLASAGPASP